MDQAAPPDSANSPLRGILWMVVTGLCFVGVTAAVKTLGDGVPAAEAAFLRYLMGLVFVLPVLPRLVTMPPTRGETAAFAVRGLFHALGVILWFYAMTQIPIAEVTAMNYLSPIFVSVGAALFLGERIAARRIAAILFALAGALVILRPGFREVSGGHLAMLGTACLFAVSYLIAKRMSGTADASRVVAMLSIWVTIGLAPFAAAVWVTPAPVELAWLFVVAVLATAGHFTMTLAFKSAPLTVTQPVTFLQLVWATAIGTVIFGEAADPWVLAGGGIIMAAVSFITWREAVIGRRAGAR